MALNKEVLKQQLIAAFNRPETTSNIETIAEAMASAIDQYVKSGQVVGVCPPSGGALTAGKIL